MVLGGLLDNSHTQTRWLSQVYSPVQQIPNSTDFLSDSVLKNISKGDASAQRTSIWSEAVQEFHIISDEKLIRSQLRSCHCEKPGTISLWSQQSDTELMVTQTRDNKENIITNFQPPTERISSSHLSIWETKWLADWPDYLSPQKTKTWDKDKWRKVMIVIGTATPGSLHWPLSGLTAALVPNLGHSFHSNQASSATSFYHLVIIISALFESKFDFIFTSYSAGKFYWEQNIVHGPGRKLEFLSHLRLLWPNLDNDHF